MSNSLWPLRRAFRGGGLSEARELNLVEVLYRSRGVVGMVAIPKETEQVGGVTE